MSVVFVCVKRATTMGVVGDWTGGLVCAVDAKVEIFQRIQSCIQSERHTAPVLLYIENERLQRLMPRRQWRNLQKLNKQWILFVGICVNLFYSHLILNDPQKDLTHYHLSMLKGPTSHVAYSTAKKKHFGLLVSRLIQNSWRNVVRYCDRVGG